ncbi:helicase associated domain-containing protein [Streptomyces sp. NRAIS4]
MPDERREKLEDIDPSWYPAWPVEWQRAFHLVRQHLKAGGALPMEPGTVVHQGEDLGRWVRSVWLGCDKLTAMQQWTCEQVLGIEPATEYEKPPPPRTQADKWAMNYAAAKQFYERKGHLRLPRKHVETIVVGVDGGDQEERELKLGTWIGNHRSRATTLTPERAEQLSTIGMRWNQNTERHMSLAPPHNLGGGAATDGLQGDRLPKPARGPDQAVRASGMLAPCRPDLCDAGHRPPAAATTAAPRL